MNDLEFYKSFIFNEFKYTSLGCNDMTKGILAHFIGYMKKGKALIIKGNQKIELQKGDMFYIPKGCKYISKWKTDDEDAVFDSIGFKFFPNNSSNVYKLQKIEYTSEIFELYKPLSEKKEVTLESIGTLYRVLSKITEIMQTEPVEPHRQTINNAIKMLNENHQQKMIEIAKNCGISESSLYNIFKQQLGKTPNTVRQEIMCKKAAELLCVTDMPIEEISYKTGFSSSSYFRKIFYSIYKTTPREYRKKSKIII